MLKREVKDKDFKGVDSFDGYTHVRTEESGNVRTHVYEKIERITRWVDTEGNVLKREVKDKDFKGVDSFDGYTHIKTEESGNVRTHIYEKIERITRWVDTEEYVKTRSKR